MTVVCEPPRFADNHKDILLNPLIVFEVLSGWRIHAYRKIDSLHEYVLASQDAYFVAHFRRDGENWIYTAAEGHDASLTLPALNCELPLDEIYRQVEIEPPPR